MTQSIELAKKKEGKMSENKSCVGCKYLYARGVGYSNYTWMETYVKCALGKNPNLLEESGKTEQPFDWEKEPDNWPMTNNSRCELYAEGPYITLDPDGEDRIEDQTIDLEQIAAIEKCDEQE